MPHSSLLTPHPSRILIVAPSWIGDTILAQPLLTRLAQRGANIDVLAPPWSAPLLRRMPEVRDVIESPFGHGAFAFWRRRAFGRALAGRYDAAYVLPNSWKSALIPFFARIPKRIGYSGEARIGLLNDRRRLDKQALPQLAQRYAQLAESPEATPSLPLPQSRLTSTLEQQRATRTALGLPLDAQPVVFCPGAEYGPAKRWPARRFAELARALGPAQPIWLLGGPKDAAVAEEIVRLADGQPLNLCGRTSLAQAIDLLAGAAAVVSNDSGLMHVAAALDRPLTAIYGSSSPAYTPPLSPHARIVSLKLECSPCFRRECPLGHLDCLEKLDAQRVLVAMKNLEHVDA